ncbi:hypothetical protein CDL12_20156 [Handroanthus impetiginosus]|uniref:Uncharacterized protein n=1 Tax=Handroanthus impetiginosus TaxID=429701 RepID=A0A2G9GPV3_9LAMI|nr:hypothetical protein CDL12_20156 [Handroanthus impetiginosus]
MTDILHSPLQFSSSSSAINNDGLHQETLVNNEPIINSNSVALYSRNREIQEVEEAGEEGEDQLSVLAFFISVFRKSLVGCRNTSGDNCGVEEKIMEIGWPTDVRHVAHVTFDRFNGFLGLPLEFEPEVPRRPPSASTRVFGVSTQSMQLSFDSRGNSVPTILLMMQRRLYSQGGLQSEGIFRINPENGQEEYVREQLNNGVVQENIDVHCLAGLIKAWFRELPNGVLDCLPAGQVMEAQSEDDCSRLVRLLPPTEAALLDWAINLMADVAQFEHLNKMNARNIAMVFAPNMTQMSDPLTALMYAVQVMNFLKTLIVKTLREREDRPVEPGPKLQPKPSDKDGENNIMRQKNQEADEISEEEEHYIHKESNSFLSSIENIQSDGKEKAADTTKSNSVRTGRTKARSQRTKTRQVNNPKKGSRKHASRSVDRLNENSEKKKELHVIRRVNSHAERVEGCLTKLKTSYSSYVFIRCIVLFLLQMSDPLTALMYAVQVMNFLKTLIVKTLREREDRPVEPGPKLQPKPSDKDGENNIMRQKNQEADEISEEEEHYIHKESNSFLSSIENIQSDGKEKAADTTKSNSVRTGRTKARSQRTKTRQVNNPKKGSRKHASRSVDRLNENSEKKKELHVIRRVNSHAERVDTWR